MHLGKCTHMYVKPKSHTQKNYPDSNNLIQMHFFAKSLTVLSLFTVGDKGKNNGWKYLQG